MYSRIFTFGCSFTRWYWPTWANIIGSVVEKNNFYNFSQPGAGNEYIFHQLTQANATYNIGKEDLVIICWTNFTREDRYLLDKWKTPGNIYTQKFYPQSWIEKYFDLKGALIKTSSFIAGSSHLLNDTGSEYHYTSIMPMNKINHNDPLFSLLEYQEVFNTYNKYYNDIKISMVDYLYNSYPYCCNPAGAFIKLDDIPDPFMDNHPTPTQHLKYVQDIIIPGLKRPTTIDDQVIDWIDQWDNVVLTSKPYFDCNSKGLV